MTRMVRALFWLAAARPCARNRKGLQGKASVRLPDPCSTHSRILPGLSPKQTAQPYPPLPPPLSISYLGQGTVSG